MLAFGEFFFFNLLANNTKKEKERRKREIISHWAWIDTMLLTKQLQQSEKKLALKKKAISFLWWAFKLTIYEDRYYPLKLTCKSK